VLQKDKWSFTTYEILSLESEPYLKIKGNTNIATIHTLLNHRNMIFENSNVIPYEQVEADEPESLQKIQSLIKPETLKKNIPTSVFISKPLVIIAATNNKINKKK
jgi:hypothetical protein